MFGSETGWLNVVNISLGLAVLVCLLAVGRMVIQDLRNRATSRAHKLAVHINKTFTLSSLGITMADGGEPIDENAIRDKRDQARNEDPPNIIRSDN